MRRLAAVGLLVLVLAGCLQGTEEPADATLPADALQPDLPPDLTVAVSVDEGPAPLEVQFSMQLHDPEGAALAWRADLLGDGNETQAGEVLPTNNSGPQVDLLFVYERPGTYAPNVTITDGNHTVSWTGLVTVTPRLIDRTYGDVRSFAATPDETYVEGIAVFGDRVYAGTLSALLPNAPLTNAGEPSQIFVWALETGAHVDTITVADEDLAAAHGIAGLTYDGVERLYATTLDGRVLRFAPSADGWDQEVYAQLPDLPTCATAPAPCSTTRADQPPMANDLVWDDAGNLYVSDTTQSIIWRIPPGPGAPQIWYQHPDIERPFGVNGLRITPDGQSMVFATTGPDNVPMGVGDQESRLWQVPFPDPGTAAPDILVRFPHDHCADGLTFGASGHLYVASICSSTIWVFDQDWNTLDQLQDPLLHFTASVAFDDDARRLLIANYPLWTGEVTPEHKAIVDLFVDEAGAVMARPVVP